MRRVSVFGATGSIGESTFDLLMRQGGPAVYDTVALTGGRNVTRLAEMARALQADIAVTAHDDCLPALRDALAGSGIEAAAGAGALVEAADRPADWIMSAIVGAAGLAPGFHALRHGTVLALANKESLVTAGSLLMGTAAKHGATILPVDSEHSAVFQALAGEDPCGGGACDHHRLGWAVPRLACRPHRRGHAGAGGGASELVDGATHLDRLGILV